MLVDPFSYWTKIRHQLENQTIYLNTKVVAIICHSQNQTIKTSGSSKSQLRQNRNRTMDKYAKQNSNKLTGSENFKQKHKKLKIKVRDKSITTRIQKIIIEVR